MEGVDHGSAASPVSLLEVTNLRPNSRPTESECEFKQNPQVIHMHIKVDH